MSSLLSYLPGYDSLPSVNPFRGSTDINPDGTGFRGAPRFEEPEYFGVTKGGDQCTCGGDDE